MSKPKFEHFLIPYLTSSQKERKYSLYIGEIKFLRRHKDKQPDRLLALSHASYISFKKNNFLLDLISLSAEILTKFS